MSATYWIIAFGAALWIVAMLAFLALFYAHGHREEYDHREVDAR